MTDTNEPQKRDDAGDNINTSDTQETADGKSSQEIFDKLSQDLMTRFGQICEEQGVQVALAVAKHPEVDEPVVFYRGHIIDAATVTANVLRQVKREVFQQLDTNPNERANP